MEQPHQLPVILGVPLDSIYGITLTNVYLNNLLQILTNRCFIAYAKDLTLTVRDKKLDNAIEQRQQILNTISAWSAENYLSLNLDICQCILINLSKNGDDLMSGLAINGQTLFICTKLTILDVKLSLARNSSFFLTIT